MKLKSFNIYRKILTFYCYLIQSDIVWKKVVSFKTQTNKTIVRKGFVTNVIKKTNFFMNLFLNQDRRFMFFCHINKFELQTSSFLKKLVGQSAVLGRGAILPYSSYYSPYSPYGGIGGIEVFYWPFGPTPQRGRVQGLEGIESRGFAPRLDGQNRRLKLELKPWKPHPFGDLESWGCDQQVTKHKRSKQEHTKKSFLLKIRLRKLKRTLMVKPTSFFFFSKYFYSPKGGIEVLSPQDLEKKVLINKIFTSGIFTIMDLHYLKVFNNIFFVKLITKKFNKKNNKKKKIHTQKLSWGTATKKLKIFNREKSIPSYCMTIKQKTNKKTHFLCFRFSNWHKVVKKGNIKSIYLNLNNSLWISCAWSDQQADLDQASLPSLGMPRLLFPRGEYKCGRAALRFPQRGNGSCLNIIQEQVTNTKQLLLKDLSFQRKKLTDILNTKLNFPFPIIIIKLNQHIRESLSSNKYLCEKWSFLNLLFLNKNLDISFEYVNQKNLLQFLWAWLKKKNSNLSIFSIAKQYWLFFSTNIFLIQIVLNSLDECAFIIPRIYLGYSLKEEKKIKYSGTFQKSKNLFVDLVSISYFPLKKSNIKDSFIYCTNYIPLSLSLSFLNFVFFPCGGSPVGSPSQLLGLPRLKPSILPNGQNSPNILFSDILSDILRLPKTSSSNNVFSCMVYKHKVYMSFKEDIQRSIQRGNKIEYFGPVSLRWHKAASNKKKLNQMLAFNHLENLKQISQTKTRKKKWVLTIVETNLFFSQKNKTDFLKISIPQGVNIFREILIDLNRYWTLSMSYKKLGNRVAPEGLGICPPTPQRGALFPQRGNRVRGLPLTLDGIEVLTCKDLEIRLGYQQVTKCKRTSFNNCNLYTYYTSLGALSKALMQKTLKNNIKNRQVNQIKRNINLWGITNFLLVYKKNKSLMKLSKEFFGFLLLVQFIKQININKYLINTKKSPLITILYSNHLNKRNKTNYFFSSQKRGVYLIQKERFFEIWKNLDQYYSYNDLFV